MRHLDLFSGIGGFALAAQWVWGDEHEIVSFCEIEDYPQRVLQKNFPGVPIHDDIKTLKATKWRGTIDLLTGGFPCQPFSTAGQQKSTTDNRYLWPEMLRIITEAHPRWVIGENVRGLTSIDNGLVFSSILDDLETEGYEVWPLVIPASALGALHRRERVWIIAHANGERLNKRGANKGERPTQRDEPDQCSETPTYSEGFRREKRRLPKRKAPEVAGLAECSETMEDATSIRSSKSGRSEQPISEAENSRRETTWPINASGCDFWATEPAVGRVVNGVSKRVDKLKGLGAAVVPQAPAQIMQAIKQAIK